MALSNLYSALLSSDHPIFEWPSEKQEKLNSLLGRHCESRSRMPRTLLLPMAGMGQRFRDAGFETPKPLIRVGAMSILQWSLKSLLEIADYERVVMVLHESQRSLSHDFAGEVVSILGDVRVDFVYEEGPKLGQGPSVLHGLTEGRVTGPVVVANCDQMFTTKGLKDLGSFENVAYLTFKLRPEDDPKKWSYVVTEPGETAYDLHPRSDHMLAVVEKPASPHRDWQPIVGVFAFRDAVSLSEAIYDEICDGRPINGEYYLAPVYNHMRTDCSDLGWYYPVETFYGLGTPEDLDFFERKHLGKVDPETSWRKSNC